MQKIRLYVGANNTTKELERSKIETVLNRHYEGYSAFEIVGYWHGERERTLMIEILNEEPAPVHAKVAKEIKKECEQDAVLLEITDVNATFIN